MADGLTMLVCATVGDARGHAALDRLAIDPELRTSGEESVPRSVLAMALNVLLFEDLLARVPSGAAYVERVRAQGHSVTFDHGALRTIRFAEGPTGALPGGIDAFARILEPLGYHNADLYPLPALKMTGHAFRHRDFPESIPQFFVSELHVDRFDNSFGAAAHRIFDGSTDPLDAATLSTLDRLASDRAIPFADAVAVLPVLRAAFDRRHGDVAEADYAVLRAQSAEAAWIATEGNAFNHATDRVADVEMLATELRARGDPIKDSVEISASGRVRQTALRADPVERWFIDPAGVPVPLTVPGSFYEFISRDIDPETGALDLRFDSANATGIFAMTRSR